MSNYVVLDWETTSKKVFNKVANHKFNKIVAFSGKDKKQHIVDYCYDNESILQDFIYWLCKHDLIVAHNAAFELSYLMERPQIYEWLQKGGKVWCTQVAEYYITNYQHQWPALRDIAVNKYNCKDRVKWIDTLFFNDKNTPYLDVNDLPKDKVLEDVKYDVLDTEQVFLKQQGLIDCRGSVFRNLIETQMDLIVSTSEMDQNGFYIDRSVLQKDKKTIEDELIICENDINQIVNKYWSINDKV